MYQTESSATRSSRLLLPTMQSAFESLQTNRTRSLLTMLGVIVGVAAVLMAVTLTQGASAQVTQSITSLGSNVLFISSSSNNSVNTASSGRTGIGGGSLLNRVTATGATQTLTRDDANAIGKIAHAGTVTPLTAVSAQVVQGAMNTSTNVEGVYPSEEEIGSWNVVAGRWMTQHDENAASPYVILGNTVASNLFGDASQAVNRNVLIKGQSFLVIGVLDAKGNNQDNVVFTPFTTMQTRLDNAQYVNSINVKVDSTENMTSTQQAITSLLQTRHHIRTGQPADFQITSSNQIASIVDQTTSTLTILLVSVAAISLIVGGIGIMNIMLVSVTERTREIGIRMAIGARRGTIRNQFLIEALFLSGIGGLIGIILGLLFGWIITLLVALPFEIVPGWIALAFAFAAFVGVIFGYYPAAQASRLDPITALRTE